MPDANYSLEELATINLQSVIDATVSQVFIPTSYAKPLLDQKDIEMHIWSFE